MSKNKVAISVDITFGDADWIYSELDKDQGPLSSKVIKALKDFSSFDGDAKITFIRKED